MAVGYSQGLLNNASKTEMPVLSMKNTLFRVYPPGGGVYPRTCVFGGGVQQTPIIQPRVHILDISSPEARNYNRCVRRVSM